MTFLQLNADHEPNLPQIQVDDELWQDSQVLVTSAFGGVHIMIGDLTS